MNYEGITVVSGNIYKGNVALDKVVIRIIDMYHLTQEATEIFTVLKHCKNHYQLKRAISTTTPTQSRMD
jgi:uncharacterized Fe-S cluster-containing MiaB family protein